MDYYLYSHSNVDGIFYIGKGCNDRIRVNSLSKRSDEWHKAAKGGYTTKIEANGSSSDIISLEQIVIKSLFSQGVNLVNKMHNPNWSRDSATRKAIGNGNKGNKRPDFSEYNKKRVHPCLGKSISKEHKYAISCSNRKRTQVKKLKKANNFKNTGCY